VTPDIHPADARVPRPRQHQEPHASHHDDVTSTSLQFDTADDRRPTSRGYRVSLAEGDEQLAAVQRLRHQIFGTEYPAALSGPDDQDVDPFDDRCDHRRGRPDLCSARRTCRNRDLGHVGRDRSLRAC